MKTLYFFLSVVILLKKISAIDGNETCVTTSQTAIDHEPWWQLDLGRDYVIYTIRIFSNQETLNAISHSETFYIAVASNFLLEYTQECYKVINSSGIYKKFIDIECKEPIIGRYVVIEKRIPCYQEELLCTLSSLPLVLCEIEIRGYRFEPDMKKTNNIAEVALVHQSGIVEVPELAVDGNKDIKPVFKPFAQCALTTGNSRLYEWWQVDLGSRQLLTKLIIHATNSAVLLVTIHKDSSVGDFTSSLWKERIFFQTSKMEIEITRQIFGQYVTIYQQEKKPLVLCEVEVWGYAASDDIVNVALGKPTNQSSTVHEGGSELAVDGRSPTTFYSFGYGNRKAQCTHTHYYKVENLPWWRVDLQAEYIVSKLHLFNRGETLHSRLHDIDIRIGNYDIVDYNNASMPFTENPRCAVFLNQFFPQGRSFVYCDNPVIGRYVSIQIIQACKLSACHSTNKDHNILTLCEVEVFGEIVQRDSLEEKNLAENKVLKHSLDEEIQSRLNTQFSFQPVDEVVDTTMDDSHPWLLIDLKTTDIINEVVIFIDKNIKTAVCPDFDVRIGNDKITTGYNGRVYRKNLSCFTLQNGVLKGGANKLKCFHSLVGRYVSIQIVENCDNDECSMKLHHFLNIERVEVHGFAFHDVKPLVNYALNKATTQIDTFSHGTSSLAVDGAVPETLFKDQKVELCSQTVDSKEYPWWQADFEFLHVVEIVKITLPGNGHNTRFHDVEIRVGMKDIRDQIDDEIFVLNPLCFETLEEEYPEGETTFYCQQPLLGQFLTIQIVDKYFSQKDYMDLPNILHLCEVEVWGYWLKDSFNMSVISKDKSSVLSSKMESVDSSLVNNGVVENLDITTDVFYSTCSSGEVELKLHDVCNRDTSKLQNCADIYKTGCKTSGVYVISYLNDNLDRVYLKIYCDMTTDGGGWTVFQRRDTKIDTSLRYNFTRHWIDYKNGFGDLCGEYWLGNYFVSHLSDETEMRIDMTAGKNEFFVHFKSFYVEGESNNFTIEASYGRGNCGDDWKELNFLEFRTYDRMDVKGNWTNTGGGWWGNNNWKTNLNGDGDRIYGMVNGNLLLLDKTEMKLRPIS